MDDIFKQIGKRAFGGAEKAKRKSPPSPGPAPKKAAFPAAATASDQALAPTNGPSQGPTLTSAPAARPVPNIDPTAPQDATATPPAAPGLPRKLRPPTIFMDAVADWETHAKNMEEASGGDFSAVYRGKYFRLQTTTVEGFRSLQSYLCESDLPFHTFHVKGERDLKVVISGLPEVHPEDLVDALVVDERFSVRNAVRMHAHWGPTKSWLITLLPDSPDCRKAAEIYNLTTLFHVRVAVSRYRKPAGPPQCYRCQRFGHGSDNCGRPLRCVRCGGPHIARSCRLAEGTKGRCCNCGGDHNANYRGCPAFKAATTAYRDNRSGRSRPPRPTAPASRQTTTPEPAAEEVDISDVSDEDAEEDPASRRRRRRPPRNPANRGPPAPRPSPPAGPLPAPRPRTTPRRKLDWPPKPPDPRPVAEEKATEPPTAGPAANGGGRDARRVLTEVLRQLTALMGILTGLLGDGSI